MMMGKQLSLWTVSHQGNPADQMTEELRATGQAGYRLTAVTHMRKHNYIFLIKILLSLKLTPVFFAFLAQEYNGKL